jgi:hypothetical protein
VTVGGPALAEAAIREGPVPRMFFFRDLDGNNLLEVEATED